MKEKLKTVHYITLINKKNLHFSLICSQLAGKTLAIFKALIFFIS